MRFRAGPSRTAAGRPLPRALRCGFPLLLLWAACAGDLSRRYPAPVTDSQSLLERLDALDRSIGTDRRVFDYRLRRGLFSTHGEGVFLYRRPDRVRIDLYAGSSELVFQYRRRGDRSSLYLPGEGRILEGHAGEIELVGIEGMEGVHVRDDELLALMLGLYPRVVWDGEGAAGLRRGADGVLLRLARGGESVALEYAYPSLALERVTLAAPARRDRTITFSDRRPVSGRNRPWTTTWVDVEHKIELRVDIREERLDEEIDDGLFGEARGPSDGPRPAPERFDNPRD